MLAVAGLHAPPAFAEAPVGSTAFCLFELPDDGSGRHRWINLGIVQYIEIGETELRIFYGGGNLGSGHEARIVVTGVRDAQALLERMKETAGKCR